MKHIGLPQKVQTRTIKMAFAASFLPLVSEA